MAAYERSSRRRLLLAAVSVLLVAVVGVSAIYAAITRDGGSPPPGSAAGLIVSPSAAPPEAAPAAAVPAEAAPELVEAGPAKESRTAEDEPDPVIDDEGPAQPDLEVESVAPASDPDVRASETGPVEPSEPALESEPAIEPTTETADEVAEPVVAAGPTASAGSAGRSPRAAETAPDDAAVRRNGWVCEGQLSFKDERLRDWAITRVSFLPGNGFERVALQLVRVGDGSGGAAAMSAQAFPTARVKQEVPSVRQPSAGRSTIALQFRGGVRSEIGLRGYQPKGLSAVKELNTYPVGRTASRVLISSSTDGCFKVRVPAFSASPKARRGQVLIDIKS